MGSRITTWASALPDRIVTNQELSETLDTTDTWITERTGIKERRVGDSTAELAAEAGRLCLEKSGLGPDDFDVVLLATTTPDRHVPATSATVQHMLGLNCGALDVNAACSGFVYGLITADGLINSGAERILLIGAETLSRIVDWTDRGTAILFGDGAGATILEASDTPSLLSWTLGCDGSLEHLLYCDIDGKMKMEGSEVFRQAILIIEESTQTALEKAGMSIDDIDMMIPHQANERIIDAACKRIGLPVEKTAQVLAHTGNTSSASIPLALVDALDAGRIQPGDNLLFVGFGAGMTAASAIMRWNP
jgi:3-oxoacyl-[acyl-carrier-protein] synthase-3